MSVSSITKELWRKSPDTYNDLPVRCSPGVHQHSARLLAKEIQKDTAVLDLAAGTGAWLSRLKDAGFINLNAIELSPQSFGLKGVTPRSIDLNSAFATEISDRYGLISAIEIWEHLDKPRDFLREIHALLEDNGTLLITTPNIGHWSGRLRFLFTGEHRYFLEQDYHDQRHISAITTTHARLLFEELGFKIEHTFTAGSFFGPIKHLLVSPLRLIFQLFCGAETNGDVIGFLLKKSKPVQDSPGRTSHYYSGTKTE